MFLSTSDTSASLLYTVNLTTGATSFVGVMNTASRANIAIAVMDGQMYGFDILNDSLQSINKATGIATTIGPLGFDANFAQGMDFDESDGTCYIFAFNNTAFAAELRTCDVATGATTLVGTIGDGATLREWTGAGVVNTINDALFCFSFDNSCDGIEISQVLPDRTVVGTWRNRDCAGAAAPMLGGYSGKSVTPRLSWLAADPDADLSTWQFNLNVDARTFDLWVHDTDFSLTQMLDDEPYSVTPGACSFGPEKKGLPASTATGQ